MARKKKRDEVEGKPIDMENVDSKELEELLPEPKVEDIEEIPVEAKSEPKITEYLEEPEIDPERKKVFDTMTLEEAKYVVKKLRQFGFVVLTPMDILKIKMGESVTIGGTRVQLPEDVLSQTISQLEEYFTGSSGDYPYLKHQEEAFMLEAKKAQKLGELALQFIKGLVKAINEEKKKKGE